MAHSLERPARGSLFAGALTAYLLAFFLLRIFGYYNEGIYLSISRVTLFPLGAALAAVLLFRSGTLRYPEVKLTAAYVLWMVVVTLISHKTTLYSYERHISYAIVFGLVCFPYGFALPEDIRRKHVRFLFYVLLGIFGVASLVALATICLQTHIIIDLSKNAFIGQHPADSFRLYFIMHPNQVAAILSLMELVCIYALLTARKTVARVYCAVLLLLFHATIAFTDSRTNMVALALCIGLLAFLILYRLRLKRLLPRVLLGLVAAGVAGVLAYGGFAASIRAVGWLSRPSVAVSETAEAAAGETDDAQAPLQTPLKRETGDVFTFTGRTAIWKETINGMLKNPILLLRGTTGSHVEDVVPVFREKFGAYIHNSFLQVLVGYGLPGLLLLLAFLVCMLGHSLRLFFESRRRVGLGEQFLPVVLLGPLIICMVESIYFSEDSGILTPLFYLVAGLVACEARALKAASAPPVPSIAQKA